VQIDHINGIHDDYRLENLRMLCPNCHSQTATYGRRNVGRRTCLQDGTPVV
jgi:5-methylcytosine-specific restriction endonuclease McrA